MAEFDNGDESREIGTDKGRHRGLVKFLRDVYEGMKSADEGRESELGYGTVRWRNMDWFIHVEYGFEEKSASPSNVFKFRPASTTAEGGTTMQGTPASNMGGKAGRVATFIDRLAGMPLEFAELDAASVGHENLTNYEFQYETHISKSDLENSNFEELIEGLG